MALPAMAWISYHVIVLALFYLGPLHWPIHRSWPLLIFLASANLMFLIGYVLAMTVPPHGGYSSLPVGYFKIGALLVVILFIPNLYIYTGKAPTELGDAIVDQGAAWSEMQRHIAETSGSRTWYAALRSILSPFTIAAIPLLFLIWKDLSLRWRAAGTLALFCAIGFSLARGTDKETVEIGLFFILSMFLLWLKSEGSGRRKAAQLAVALFAGAIAVTLVLGLFVTRKSARLGDVVTYCQPVTGQCSDYDNRLIGWLPTESLGAASVVVNYLTQGYYGLSLAIEKPFESTFGLGHSAFLLTQYERTHGTDDFMSRAYLLKIDEEDGWPRKHSWSTAYIWLANDIGFTGTALSMLIFGFIAGMAWRDYIYRDNLSAFLVIVLFSITLFFIPMNLQLTQTADYYLPSLVWLAGWLLTRGTKSTITPQPDTAR